MQGFVYDLLINAAGSLVTSALLLAGRRLWSARQTDRRQQSEGGSTGQDS